MILWPCQGDSYASQRWWLYNCADPGKGLGCLVASASSGYRMCWDLRSYDPGTPVGLNDCNGTFASQRWSLVPIGSPPHLYLQTAAGPPGWPEMCLDLRSYRTGTAVILNYCDADFDSQQWRGRFV